MKTIIAALAVALALALPASGGWRHPKLGPPATPGVTFLYCVPRAEGDTRFICAERGPKKPRLLAWLYLEPSPTGLFGVRVPEPKR